jgi:hypothetical protein
MCGVHGEHQPTSRLSGLQVAPLLTALEGANTQHELLMNPMYALLKQSLISACSN